MNLPTIKDYTDMPLVEINGKVYVDREIFKGYALNLLAQEMKDEISTGEQIGIETAMNVIDFRNCEIDITMGGLLAVRDCLKSLIVYWYLVKVVLLVVHTRVKSVSLLQQGICFLKTIGKFKDIMMLNISRLLLGNHFQNLIHRKESSYENYTRSNRRY